MGYVDIKFNETEESIGSSGGRVINPNELGIVITEEVPTFTGLVVGTGTQGEYATINKSTNIACEIEGEPSLLQTYIDDNTIVKDW